MGLRRIDVENWLTVARERIRAEGQGADTHFATVNVVALCELALVGCDYLTLQGKDPTDYVDDAARWAE